MKWGGETSLGWGCLIVSRTTVVSRCRGGGEERMLTLQSILWRLRWLDRNFRACRFLYGHKKVCSTYVHILIYVSVFNSRMSGAGATETGALSGAPGDTVTRGDNEQQVSSSWGGVAGSRSDLPRDGRRWWFPAYYTHISAYTSYIYIYIYEELFSKIR